MKKFTFIAVLAGLLIGGLSSCNDDKANFSIYGVTAYVLDEGYSYKPVIWFGVYNGNLAKASVTRGGLPLQGHQLEGYNIYEIYSDYETASSLTSLNGSYVASAQSVEGELSEVPFTFNFSEKNVLGDFGYEDFSYSNGVVSFTVPAKVENASAYGFYINPVFTSSQFRGSYVNADLRLPAEAGSTANQKITFNITDHVRDYLSSNTANEVYLEVYPAVVSGSNTGIVVKRGTAKTIKYNGSSFEEDRAQ